MNYVSADLLIAAVLIYKPYNALIKLVGTSRGTSLDTFNYSS